jgi:hypothetical protein
MRSEIKGTELYQVHGNIFTVLQRFAEIDGKYHEIGKVNMELQLDATIIVLLISKISSTCFGQTFAHLQERKT